VEGNAEATAAFFETGENDLAALLAAIASVLGRDVRPTCALDFGCGVGRLTLPLARRARRVVACDVAPTMLAHARQNAEDAGLRNITFMSGEGLGELAPEFDFICSLLVFEYIPAAGGYDILRALMALLAPGGIAAIQVVFRRRLARLLRARSRPPHRPQSDINRYDEDVFRDSIEAGGAQVVARLPTSRGGATGAVMIIVKPL